MTLLSIGDFSRMTHLSVKALRHYHDMGVLVPAAIDPFSGYRSYDTGQVPTAQVIRRLRDLNMPLDQIRAVLEASDVGERNQEIVAHLERMERQLQQTQTAVAGLAASGYPGALFPNEYFEAERGELTLFVPVLGEGAADPGGPVRLLEIPAAEVAVMVHEGAADDIDRTYGALGTAVAERAIGVDGPIREYYLVSFADTDDEREHRTEVCWPVFRTAD